MSERSDWIKHVHEPEVASLNATIDNLRRQNGVLTEALQRCCEVMRSCPPNCTVGQWFAVVDKALAALRAAGIEIEG